MSLRWYLRYGGLHNHGTILGTNDQQWFSEDYLVRQEGAFPRTRHVTSILHTSVKTDRQASKPIQWGRNEKPEWYLHFIGVLSIHSSFGLSTVCYSALLLI